MSIIINPGSENKGGTLEQATKNAEKWLESIHNEGYPEVEMLKGEKDEYGSFAFIFKHGITKKEVTLLIHGFTDKECKEFIFHPRVYWSGSSTGDPEIEDFLPDGWKYKIQYYKE